jgi:hypothetical protein
MRRRFRNETTRRLFAQKEKKVPAMLAPLATLAFLATIWLVVTIGAEMLGTSGRKIVMALKGRSLLASEPGVRPVAVRVSQRARPQRTMRAQPRLRAAA